MIGWLVAAVLSAATPAQAAEPPRFRPVVTNFAWRREPRARLPQTAREAGVREGLVRLSCDFTPDGALTICTILSESHPGLGLGSEALAAARRGRLAERALQDVAGNAQYHFEVVLR